MSCGNDQIIGRGGEVVGGVDRLLSNIVRKNLEARYKKVPTSTNVKQGPSFLMHKYEVRRSFLEALCKILGVVYTRADTAKKEDKQMFMLLEKFAAEHPDKMFEISVPEIDKSVIRELLLFDENLQEEGAIDIQNAEEHLRDFLDKLAPFEIFYSNLAKQLD